MSIAEWQKQAASAPISGLASRRLDQRWKDVRKRASDLSDLDDAGLHQLRIAVKKLRYAVDFLGSLYGKRARKFTSRLEKIQDGLGLMNDAVVGRQLIADLSLRAVPARPEADRAERLQTLQGHFRKLGKVGRFW